MSSAARVVVLISGRGSNLKALIDQSALFGSYSVVGVLSDRANAAGLEHAYAAGCSTMPVPRSDGESREAYEERLMFAVDAWRPDIVALAGFMRVLGDAFVARYAGRLVNIHPSLLPNFPGLDTHRRAIEAGEHEHGASVHYVASEVDSGPVIAQVALPIEAEDDATVLAARVLHEEHRLYPTVLDWLARGWVRLHEGRVWFGSAPLATPVRLAST